MYPETFFRLNVVHPQLYMSKLKIYPFLIIDDILFVSGRNGFNQSFGGGSWAMPGFYPGV